MIKRYTFNQLENFVKGYRVYLPSERHGLGKFQASICDAMDQIYSIALYDLCYEDFSSDTMC